MLDRLSIPLILSAIVVGYAGMWVYSNHGADRPGSAASIVAGDPGKAPPLPRENWLSSIKPEQYDEVRRLAELAERNARSSLPLIEERCARVSENNVSYLECVEQDEGAALTFAAVYDMAKTSSESPLLTAAWNAMACHWHYTEDNLTDWNAALICADPALDDLNRYFDAQR